MRVKKTGEILTITFHSLSLIYLLIVWGELPELVPIHYKDGIPDNWTSKTGLLLILICIQAFLYFLFKWLAKWSIKNSKYKNPMNWILFRVGTSIIFGTIGCLMVYFAGN